MGSSESKNSRDKKTLKKPCPKVRPVSTSRGPEIILDGHGQPFIDDGFGQPKKDPKARDDSHSFPLDGIELSSVSDEQLAQYFTTAPKLHEYGAVDVVRLSKILAMKGGKGVDPCESHNMIFAAKSLLLPVPGVHRTFTSDIPGDSPGEIDTMDQTQRKSVARQVASMLEKMQTTSLQLPPGPIWRTNNQKFEGFWFTDYGAGPFGTLKDLEDWCNHKIDVCIKFKQLPDDSERFVFRDLVLTHQDIAPRNLIIDKDGKVWMIDWGLAGVYPPGFEQAVLEVYAYSSEGFQEMVFAELTLSSRQEKVIGQFKAIGYGLSVAAHH